MEDVDRRWPGPRTFIADDLEHALSSAINRFSAENGSDTPDFILAQYLLGCLAAWNDAVKRRESWYGREPRAVATTGGSGVVSVDPRSE